MPRKKQPGSRRRRQPPPPALPHLDAFLVWDWPTRLSHWAITVLFVFEFVTGQFSLVPESAHLWVGYLLLVAVLFRLQWGAVGSSSARFSSFVAGPRAVLAYLPRLISSRPTHWPGHNPVGAVSIVLLLSLLLVQCVTGLFVETWAEVRGPLAERVSRSTAILMSDLHGLIRWPLLVLVLVHVTASLYYRAAKKENRISAIFVHGRLELEEDPGFQSVSWLRAWIVLATSLVAVALIVWRGPIG